MLTGLPLCQQYIGVSHPIGANHPIGDRKAPVGTGSHIGAWKDRAGTRSHIGVNHQEDNECTEPRIARRLDDHAAAPAGETTTTHIQYFFCRNFGHVDKDCYQRHQSSRQQDTRVIVARTAGRQMSHCCLAIEHYQGLIRTHLIYRNSICRRHTHGTEITIVLHIVIVLNLIMINNIQCQYMTVDYQ